MTASTDKKKGPIRWGAVIPALLFCGLISLYAHFWLDGHLRQTMIWTGEYFYGAEINISSVNSSFLNGKLRITGIQITDKDKPERNLVSLGDITFKLDVAELLKAKFIVDTGEIKNIQWHSQRKRPGKVYPKDQSQNPRLKAIENTALEVAQENLEGNALGNVANVLAGNDIKTELKDIKSELKTEKKIKELEADLKNKETYYDNKLKELKKTANLKELNNEIKSYKWNKRDPIGSLSKANKLIQKTSSTYKTYEREIRRLRDDIKNLDKEVKNIDQWIEEDMNNLQQMAGVPSLDPEKIALSLFGKAFGANVTTLRKYSEIAKEYMPPPKSERPQETLVPRKRGEGETITFEKVGENPKLWIKKILVSSQANQSKYSGDLEGVITDITNSPRITGKPISFSLKGDFPNQKLFALDLNGNLNHHKKEASQDFQLSVGSFPFPEKKLSKSKDLTLKLLEQAGSLNLQGKKKDDLIQVTLSSSLKDPSFSVDSPKKLVKEIVTNSLSSMREVTMSASAQGKWEELKWNFRSNLAKELASGLKKEMSNQLKKAEQDLKNKLQAKIGPLKEKYKGQVDKLKNKLKSQLKAEEEKIKRESKEALNKIKGQQKDSVKKNTDKIKNKAKKFLKKLF